MGSKFLDSKTTNLATLQDGSFPINVSSAIVQSLAPNLPVRTTLNKSIVSGLIGISDVSFVPITNPMSANLDLGNNNIIDVLSLLLTANPTPTTPPIGMLTL